MPDTGCLLASVLSSVLAAMFVLFPHALLKLSDFMNRSLTVLDARLMRMRYGWAVVLFVLSYALFKLSLMMPALRD